MLKYQYKYFLHKLLHWEFWSFGIVYFLVKCYYLLLSIRSRSFLFFTASNPGLENSGFIGESKSMILDKIPSQYVPAYFKTNPVADINTILKKIEQNNMLFPLIAKPDVGERGRGVEKINNYADLYDYNKRIGVPYIIQQYIDYPVETGIFYYRLPNSTLGTISSIVLKDFLKVKGNGKSSLKQLIKDYPRAAFRFNYLHEKFKSRWNEIVPEGEEIVLENIGNHVRGTTFLNGNFLITTTLKEKVNEIAMGIEGFYYGRFDIRCPAYEDLKQGKNLKILELNGAGSEPAHIYQPGFSFWKGQKVLLKHWYILYRISTMNHMSGYPYMRFGEALSVFRQHKLALSKIGV